MRVIKGMVVCVLWVSVLAGMAAPQERLYRVEGRIRIAGREQRVGPIMVQLKFLGAPVFETISYDGTFRFEDVPMGQYLLEVSSPGQLAESRPVSVLGNEYLDLELGKQTAPARAEKTVSALDLQAPAPARHRYEQAAKLIRANHCDEAVLGLQAAIDLFPRYQKALNELGNCWVLLNRPQAAEDAFRRALDLAPALFPTLNLAALYRSQGRLPEAEALLSGAVRQFPEEGNVYFEFARLRFAQNRLKEAEELGDQAHRKRDHTSDVHILLAQIHKASKHYDRIRADLEQYVAEAEPGQQRDRVRSLLRQSSSSGMVPSSGNAEHSRGD